MDEAEHAYRRADQRGDAARRLEVAMLLVRSKSDMAEAEEASYDAPMSAVDPDGAFEVAMLLVQHDRFAERRRRSLVRMSAATPTPLTTSPWCANTD